MNTMSTNELREKFGFVELTRRPSGEIDEKGRALFRIFGRDRWGLVLISGALALDSVRYDGLWPVPFDPYKSL